MPTCRHSHPGHRKVGRKRFPNKSVKVKERAYKQVREIEGSVSSDVPTLGVVLDLGIDKVASLIRTVTMDNEDAFQDAWLAIMEDHVATEEDIIRIAKEIRYKYAREVAKEFYTEQRLSEPFGNTENFTPEEIIAAPPTTLDFPVRQTWHGQRSIRIDNETRKALLQQFPNLSAANALRHLLSLPPAPSKLHLWQPWEDDIIKQHFPYGGSLGVSLELENRTSKAIRKRAQKLGVKLTTFRPKSDWLTTKEVAQILRCDRHRVLDLRNKGVLPAIEVKGRSNNPFLYFTEDSVVTFIRSHEWEYGAQDISKPYQSYIPQSRLLWISKDEAARALKCSKGTIARYIRLGMIPKQLAYHKHRTHTLVRLEDVQRAQQLSSIRGKQGCPKLPFKVAESNGLNHYVYQDEDGDWYLRCFPHPKNRLFHAGQQRIRRMRKEGLTFYPKLRFLRGQPTCKHCLKFAFTPLPTAIKDTVPIRETEIELRELLKEI